MSVTEEQRRDFETEGWFHMGSVFTDDELDEITREYDRIMSRPLRIGEQGKRPFEYSALLHVQSEIMRRYAIHSGLVEVAVDLLGPEVRLYWDQAVSKPPGATSDVPWHQDNGYTPVEPEEYVTFTVAIDETSEQNGCLWIQPGSHRSGVQPHRPTDMIFFRGYDGPDTGVAAPQARGDVMAFSSLTLHRSGANTSDRPRRSWVIQYCHGDAHHKITKVPFDDRLLCARDGVPLAEPERDRPLDLSVFAKAAKGVASPINEVDP